MDPADTIPLFPLATVVFPGQVLPLHVFEERYKQMVADCAQAAGQPYRPFGISLEQDGEVAEVGCAVTVLRVGGRYPDGSFDIVCRAHTRYRTVEVYQDRPYLRGRVEFFEDEEGSADPALEALVRERFRALVELAAREVGSAGGPQGAGGEAEEGDAFAVALRLGLEARRKQRLLEMRSENARLQHLAEYLEEVLPALEERAERRRRVKSNGRNR